MVTHRLSCFSYVYFSVFYRPTQRVGLSLFPSFFLSANSTCWPISFFFFTGQLNVLASHSTARWTSSALSFAFPHARKIFLEGLAINSHGKLDTVQFLEHVCISRQNLINLIRPMPSWGPLAIFSIFSPQRQHCLPDQVSNLKFFGLTFL